jgi:hypothetical protein
VKRRPAAPSAHAELPFTKPTRTARRKATKLDRERETLRRGELRHDVIVRSNGRCEFCRVPVPPGELHHLLAGSQRRRCESLSTLAFVCVPCHAAYHRNDEDVLWWAKSWANAHGFAESLAEVTRRIEKLHEARWLSLRAPAGEAKGER